MALIDFSARETAISGLSIMTVKQVTDDRGTVRELYRRSSYAALDPRLAEGFAQLNVTYTRRGAIRGLHGEAMTKLVGVIAGTAFGAYVDARVGSPTFGKLVTAELSVGTQVLVPEGVLNGFQSTGDGGCEYLYGFNVEWEPGMAGIGVCPLDPDLAIGWPIEIDPEDRALVSAKDAGLPSLAALRDG